jgi:hypothetical protein
LGVALFASRECKVAVERANSVLALAVQVRARAGPTHHGRLPRDPASFDRAPADYRRVVDRCPLRTR